MQKGGSFTRWLKVKIKGGYKMNIGKKLKAIRLQKGYSITEVVDEASLGGRSRKADIARLERIEEGKDQPTIEQLLELQSVLKFELDEMVDRELTDQVEDWEVFNNNCRKLYLEHDYTLKELEEKMDIRYYNTVSRLFSNSEVKKVKNEDIQKIIDFFDVDMEYLNTPRDINYFDKPKYKGVKGDDELQIEIEIKKLKNKVDKQEKEIAELKEKLDNSKKSIFSKMFSN